MSAEAVTLVLLLGIAASIILTRYLCAAERAAYDRAASAVPPPAQAPEAISEDHVQELIDKWGIPGSSWRLPPGCVPVNTGVEQLLASFAEINFDNYVFPFVRQLVTVHEFNPEFVVIGDLGEGSPTLVRKAADDVNIYVVHVEETDPRHPELFARSVSEYLVLCERLYLQTLEELGR